MQVTQYVKFNEELHQYKNSETNEVYRSATQLIDLYKPKYDKEYWSLYKAIEEFFVVNKLQSDWWTFLTIGIRSVPKKEQLVKINLELHYPEYVEYILELQQIILKRWEKKGDDSRTRGTAYHLYREELAYSTGTQPLEGVAVNAKVAQYYSFDLRDLSDGFHGELLVYNHRYKISGLVDRLWVTSKQITESDIRKYKPENIWRKSDGTFWIKYIDLDDWKTNAKIKTENKYQKMLEPIDHLQDCSLYHYQIQISLYAWMLEQVGYIVRSTRFTWVKAILDAAGKEQISSETGVFVNEEVPFKFEYRKNDIEKMLNHYQQHNT